MSTRLISRPNLAKTIANVLMPTVQDVNVVVAQAVNALFSQYCRRVDAKGDCVVAPVDPQLLVSKFMQDAVANEYESIEIAPDKPNLPRFNFVATLTPPFTELLHGRLKRNVAMAIVGFAVASYINPFPVTAINIYNGPTEVELLKTAQIYTSIPVELPNLMSAELPVRTYFMLLSEPVIVPPEGILRLQAVVHPAFTGNEQADLRTWIMWIPPVILTSRSAYIEALAPRRSPVT
jgi:hypothetical protein